MKKIETIYCDFDGTITKKDAVNTFFEKYANPKWIESEKLWCEGKISSRENAIRQVGMINPISQKELYDYMDSIQIDDFFLEFVDFLKSKNINLVILSDGFDLFIKYILDKYKIKDVKFFANHLIYENRQFQIEFPHYNKNCIKHAGMCKCSKITDEYVCYIGDGTSDLCVAQKADILFASKSLKTYCKNNQIKHYAFENFHNILEVISLITE